MMCIAQDPGLRNQHAVLPCPQRLELAAPCKPPLATSWCRRSVCVASGVFAREAHKMPTEAWGAGRVTLVGDAAHPIRPSTGVSTCWPPIRLCSRKPHPPLHRWENVLTAHQVFGGRGTVPPTPAQGRWCTCPLHH